MRKIIFSVLSVFVLVSCNQAPKSYTISGTLDTDEFNGNWVYVAETLRRIATEPLDSAQIIDGKFEMKGVATEPLMAVLVVTDANRQMTEHGVGTYFILENGDITMHVDTAYETTAQGPKLNRVYETYNTLVTSYGDNSHKIATSDMTNAEKFEALTAERTNYKESLKSLLLPHSATQPGRELIKDIKHLYTRDELVGFLPVDTAEKARVAQSEYMSIDCFLSDEATPNADGDTIRWMDIVSQYDYTLIDFWASWCGPCMRAMPWLKEVYAEHAGEHFEIIGVSLDFNRDNWLGAIKGKELNWIHLTNLKGWQDPMAAHFEIQFIPSMILVDREGRIILRNPNHDELEIYLAQ